MSSDDEYAGMSDEDVWGYESTTDTYRGYEIRRGGGFYEFAHEDYDGPPDPRCGYALSLDLAMDEIDEIEDSLEQARQDEREGQEDHMNLESLQILAKSDPQVFAETIEEFGVQVVGKRNTDPLETRVQEESVRAMASVLTEDINDPMEFTPFQKAIQAIAEDNGLIVALCLECAMRKRANAKKRRK